MAESSPWWNCLLTWGGVFFFLLDIGMDIKTVVSFYKDGAYVYMGLMIFFLLGSSVLLQVFSWLWYSDSLAQLETKVEKFAYKYDLIKPLHFLQFGVYLRYAAVLEISIKYFRQPENILKYIPYLILDFQMLRLFETFSESAPQLTLMVFVVIQRGELEFFTGLKLLSSAGSIAFTLASYHYTIRKHFDVKSLKATGVYLLWNFLLIIPRVIALALFCSVLPCYITAHFLSLWMVLVLVAWSQKKDSTKSCGHQWLFRATVGLIWYFSWFNVSKPNIKLKHAIYCIFIVLDTMLLLGFWCWKVTEYAGCWTSLNPITVIPTLLGLYVVGILVLTINYKWFYPNYEPNIDKLTQKINNGEFKKEIVLGYRLDTPDTKVPGVLLRSRTMAKDFYF